MDVVDDVVSAAAEIIGAELLALSVEHFLMVRGLRRPFRHRRVPTVGAFRIYATVTDVLRGLAALRSPLDGRVRRPREDMQDHGHARTPLPLGG